MPGDTDRPQLYSALVRGLHWLVFATVVVVFVAVWWREVVDTKPLRAGLLNVHAWGGMLLWALTWIRLTARLRHRPLRPDHNETALARLGKELAHAVLYVCLLAMPVLGWALLSSKGKAMPLPFNTTLPMIASPDEDLEESLHHWHETGAWIFLGVMALHVLAAAWHVAVKKDAALFRITGWFQPNSQQQKRAP